MKLRVFGVLSIILSTLALSPATLIAHTPSGTTYPYAWQERTINFFFSNQPGHPNYWTSIPGLADRAIEGMITWNNAPANFAYNNAGALDGLDPNSCGVYGVGQNGIFWGAIDGPGGILGETHGCAWASGRMYSAHILIDGQDNWYTGTGTPAADALDLRSVATHELGHANGLFYATGNHWNQINAALCPGNSDDQSLCSATRRGTTHVRTLGSHDSHTFSNRYP